MPESGLVLTISYKPNMPIYGLYSGFSFGNFAAVSSRISISRLFSASTSS